MGTKVSRTFRLDSGTLETIEGWADRLGVSNTQSLEQLVSAGDTAMRAGNDSQERKEPMDASTYAIELAAARTQVEMLERERGFLLAQIATKDDQIRSGQILQAASLGKPRRPWWQRLFGSGDTDETTQ